MSALSTVSFAPAIVNVEGKTKTERQLSVVRNACPSAMMALASAGGKVGKVAVSRAATNGLASIAKSASTGNYKPAAEFFAGRTGKAVVIRTRSAFESLPDQFEAAIMQAQSGKNGGYTVGKDGVSKPGSTLKLAMELKAIATELVATAAHYANQGKTVQLEGETV